MSYRPRKALIIGAGIAGPVAAVLLRRAGIESAIYEAWPYSKGIGGGLQIAPNGMHVMDGEGDQAAALAELGKVLQVAQVQLDVGRQVIPDGLKPRKLRLAVFAACPLLASEPQVEAAGHVHR